MKQKNQSAVLSYYGLYLLQYLKENHPDKTADTDFIAVRDELASDPYGKPAMVYGHRLRRVRAQSPRLRAQDAEAHCPATQPSAATILHPLQRRKEKRHAC